MEPICWLGLAILGLIIWVAGLQARANAETRNAKAVKDRVDTVEVLLEEHEHWHEEPEAFVSLKSGKLEKATEDAACYDVYASEDVFIKPGEFQLVPTGIITEMIGCDALLFDRSGLALKFWLTRRAGVIDEKYPEEWGVVVANEGRIEYQVKAGTRICQVLFLPKAHVVVTADPNGTGTVLVSGDKRVGGFGSTGT